MKFSIDQAVFAKAISLTSRAVSSRSTMPILSNLMLKAEDGRLRLSATNSHMGINYWLGADVEREGAITVPARLIADYVSRVSGTITVDADTQKQTVIIVAGQRRTRISGIDAFDFPLVPTGNDLIAEGETEVIRVLTAGQLVGMIRGVAHAASEDDSRPVLTCICITFQKELITMAATDGYRLSIRKVKPPEGQILSTEATVLIPAKHMVELARLASEADPEELVDIVVERKTERVLFRLNSEHANIDFFSNLVDAKFPPYESIIPRSGDTEVKVDVATLEHELRLAMLFARDNAYQVTLDLSAGDRLNVFSINDSTGGHNGYIDCEVAGKEIFDVTLDCRFILESLEAIDGDTATLWINAPTRPVAIFPPGRRDDALQVLMPMHRKQ